MKGTRVMLVMGRCGGCGEPKHEILRAILDWKDGITDLVVDARTAYLLLGEGASVKPAAES
jgi:hypothetical protein